MKKLFISLLCLGSLIACKDESATSGEAAITPQDRCILQGYGCQDTYAGQSFYGNYGYPMAGGVYAGFAGNGYYNQLSCGPGTQPVANGTFGIGCLPNHLVPNVSYSTYSIQVGGQMTALAMSCRSGAQCVTGRCVQVSPFAPGVCSRH